MNFDPADKLIIALDGMSKSEASSFLFRVPGIRWVKIGLELFVSAGPQFVQDVRGMGKKVFLDLKFHDIPETMARACSRATSTGSELISVHACAGSKALSACQGASIMAAAEAGLSPPKLLAITVLTSWSPSRLAEELFVKQPLVERVDKLAELAKNAGLGGCVCSPKEVNSLRCLYPYPFELVTPGIRPHGAPCNDQARVMSPSEALVAGSSRLVVGRPITGAENPGEAFLKCCSEVEQTFQE